ncbi:MAG: protein-L-isoaspartate(D-aspartate) O-methyltransferase [Acidobacteriota bacterium]
MSHGHDALAILREKMVQREVIDRGITDERVIEAMLTIPRHAFVDEALSTRAYGPDALPIGQKQTISKPHTVALMSSLLAPTPDDDVLEIGTGSGYQAAVMSRLARSVWTIERIPALIRRARQVLAKLGLDNVNIVSGDGTVGLPEQGPWTRIIVTAASPDLPEILFEQLAERGKMVVPVAEDDGTERLQVVERIHGRRVVTGSEVCSFVPLIGEDGYRPPNRHS